MKHVSGLVQAVRRGIDVRGGGVRGFTALLARVWRMLLALGARGVLARLRAASRTSSVIAPPEDGYKFPLPAPIEGTTLRVGVMLHLFYADLAEEFATALSHMPVPFVLLVSVADAVEIPRVRQAFAGIDVIRRIEVIPVPNRGRDIAPLLVTFREDLLELDIVCHLHSKKSLHSKGVQSRWRSYLVDSLLGSRERITWQLGMFIAEPSLGLLYPESHETFPLWGHTWLGNAAIAREIADRIGFQIDASAYIDFPAGSMFWARLDAIRPLLQLELPLTAFPEESGQLDGTLQHAIERLFVAVARSTGYRIGVLPQDGNLSLSSEGSRNWTAYFASPLRERIDVAAVDAKLISLDVFDTLVQRPFLSPEGARRYLSRLAARTLGVDAFEDLRIRAEASARHALGRDPTLVEIYAALAERMPCAPVDALQALELSTEQRLLRTRPGVIESVSSLKTRGLRVIALSDMYLDGATLREVLPPQVAALTEKWSVSCETGLRKDDGSAWPALASWSAVAPAAWLHVGDNEHADIQQPHWQGMLTPAHVLRASALFDVVPALRPLRPAADAPWPEQLRLGLIANHFSAIADIDPTTFLDTFTVSPRTLGYAVIGPLVLDYLIWLIGKALASDVSTVLFLSREGHLLVQAFERLQAATPDRTGGLRGRYFLASRQATGLASLRDADDLATLLEGTYNGTLGGLLDARLGVRAAASARDQLGGAMDEMVFLPEMHNAVVTRLSPVLDALLALAENARTEYRAYWRENVGDKAALIADIGYAGTIQRNLSRLLGHPVDGAYFALDDRAERRLSGISSAHARYYDGRRETGRSTVLAHDLLLESILTAPHAQFSGFESCGEGRQPIFAGRDADPARWQVIEAVHAGALAFIDDALDAAGPLVDELVFDVESVQIPLECIGNRRWHAPWLAGIGIEDAFTGRGQVPAAGR
ncbi:rhamnan synthesis F family protein [Luteimonas terrae]|uniref:Polysaccharide biosynthesis protein n=1 Tax=Luteimonas terrae TaxID=1530191 RepID=A0A4R5U6X9_9GAMM|nr:rhamnan synthesis F family protein [Luteimonas terrae]TDK30005.1 polysaccharide biosynthesis protein [Luteimonas terrae]